MADIVDAVRRGDVVAAQRAVHAAVTARRGLPDMLKDLVLAFVGSFNVTARNAAPLVAAVWPTFVLGLWPGPRREPSSSAGADYQLAHALLTVAKTLNQVDKSGRPVGAGYDALVRAIGPYLRKHFVNKLAKLTTSPALATRLLGLLPDVTVFDVAEAVIHNALSFSLDDLQESQNKLEQLTPVLSKADVPTLLASLYRRYRYLASRRTDPEDRLQLNITMRVLERQLKKEVLPEAMLDLESRRGGTPPGLLETSTKFAAARRRAALRAKANQLSRRTVATATRLWPGYTAEPAEEDTEEEDTEEEDTEEVQEPAGAGMGASADDTME